MKHSRGSTENEWVTRRTISSPPNKAATDNPLLSRVFYAKGFVVCVPPTCLSRFESNRREAKLTSPGANREAWKCRHSPKIDRVPFAVKRRENVGAKTSSERKSPAPRCVGLRLGEFFAARRRNIPRMFGWSPCCYSASRLLVFCGYPRISVAVFIVSFNSEAKAVAHICFSHEKGATDRTETPQKLLKCALKRTLILVITKSLINFNKRVPLTVVYNPQKLSTQRGDSKQRMKEFEKFKITASTRVKSKMSHSDPRKRKQFQSWCQQSAVKKLPNKESRRCC